MQLISAIVLLGILIFVHELGHFLFAKLLGIPVLKFSLGFGPRIIGFRRGETEYQIAAIPLGGFVKMLGEDPGEEVPEEQRKRAFNAQPVWKRMSVVAAGPLFNVAFAAVLFSILIMVGLQANTATVGKVIEGTPAESAGLMGGDRIMSIDGIRVKLWEDMTELIQARPGKEITLELKRGGEINTVTLTARAETVKDIFGEDHRIGRIGITPAEDFEKVSMPFTSAVAWGAKRTWYYSKLTVVVLVKLIQRVIPADNLGGPILIVQLAGQQAARGIIDFFMFMAVISINLGVVNSFPIPILDGGHILFMIIEAVRGKPLSQRTLELAQRAGLLIILGIMVFAIYNDILRVFNGQGGTP